MKLGLFIFSVRRFNIQRLVEVFYFQEKYISQTCYQLETGSLSKGEKIIVMGPTTGVVQTIIEELRVDDSIVDSVMKGQIFSTPIGSKIRKSDKLYKLVPA